MANRRRAEFSTPTGMPYSNCDYETTLRTYCAHLRKVRTVGSARALRPSHVTNCDHNCTEQCLAALPLLFFKLTNLFYVLFIAHSLCGVNVVAVANNEVWAEYGHRRAKLGVNLITSTEKKVQHDYLISSSHSRDLIRRLLIQ